MNAAQLERLAAAYPAMAQWPADLQASALADAHWLQVPASTRLFEAGDACPGFPLVLAGAVQVARGSPGGRQLELYRVTPGELCVVSTAGLTGPRALSAHGTTVQATELVLLSAAGFEAACRHPEFRRFVFGTFAERLADLMALAEAVAFQRLDQRLAQALLGRGTAIRSTHQALADELGTVREIVSRLLARFERAGWVALGRERIEVLDAAALRALAAGSASP
jgi:CRP/FNR family transcriptional regulator, anaerobic regulatory protein